MNQNSEEGNVTTGVEIAKRDGMWDTHAFYDTISHFHLSHFPKDGEYADICVVECRDGRWFLVDDQGTSKDNNILDKCSEEFVRPKFFDSAEAAQKYAVSAINIISGTPLAILNELFSDND